MGQGRRLIETPDGQVLNQVQHDQYMHDVYNPQQDFLASENMMIPGYGNVPVSPMTGVLSPDRQAAPGWTHNLLNGNMQSQLRGLNSQLMHNGFTGQDWRNLLPVGMSGPDPQIPRPLAAPSTPNSGPYGQQAMRMAGLLSGPVESMPAGGGGNGLLGGGRIGFRLPYGGK